jgi:hypothetical protein
MTATKPKYTVTKVSASFAGKIPTQQYGNVDVQLTYEADLEAGTNPDDVAQELFLRVRQEVTRAVMPIAQAKLQGALAQMRQALPHKQADDIMSQFGAVAWLQAVAPETAFAGLDQLIEAQKTLTAIANAKTIEDAQKLAVNHLSPKAGDHAE